MRTPLLLSLWVSLLPAAAIAVTPSISTGNSVTVVLTADGNVLTWGDNTYGQLGDGTFTDRRNPVRVSGLNDVTAAWAGDQYGIALRNDGTVWTWGYNGSGQLGDGTFISRPTAGQVNGLAGITAVRATWHSLALRDDGTVWAWGYNFYGQLGDGSLTDRPNPVPVVNLTGVAAIAMGYPFSVALKDDGTVWTWGGNADGALGNGTFVNQLTPIQVPGLSNVAAISARDYHVLALKRDGTVWAWGANSSGQLGDGTTTTRPSPVRVSSLTGISAIAAGFGHSLALKSDGTVWAWGDNDGGNIGDGTTTQRPTPVRVTGLSDVVAISAGDSRSQALKKDGSVWAWGDNTEGQLGDGSTTMRTAPVAVHGENGVGTLNLGAAAPIQAVAPVVISGGQVSVTATATFPPQYVGRRIYLFAYVPASLVRLRESKDDLAGCVLAKIDRTGFTQIGGPGDLLSNNVVNGVKQSIQMISSVLISKAAGAKLCMGVGSTGTEAASPGNFVCPASVLDAAGAVCQPPAAGVVIGNGVTAKSLGSRGRVSPSNTLYGGFELSGSSTVYILVRGNSLGTLGVTPNFLDAPRVRLYNSAGQDVLGDATGPGFNGCSSTVVGGPAIVNYYTTVRHQPPHVRDACTGQTLPAGPYTFSVTPTVGLSAPSSGEILFEVVLGNGTGAGVKTLGSRASVSPTATLYGGFEVASRSNIYFLVRGNSLGSLNVTQAFLDGPRVRIFNSKGEDLISSGDHGGFNACFQARPNQTAVFNYYQNTRKQPVHERDGCLAMELNPGVYTFSVTPSIIGVTTTTGQSNPNSGEVLFEVTLN